MTNAPDNSSRKALGKGLSSLLPGRAATPVAAPPPAAPAQPPTVNRLPIDQIEPNPNQPRTVFDPARLQELAASIQANGIIQPLIVRKIGDKYHLIAGERRWRASRLAGLKEVPIVIADIHDDRLLEVALIENIQREDLNPIEVAVAFEKLSNDLGLSHEEIGKRTGKDRTTITNMLRLLRLPGDVQLLLAEKRLSMGHARAILGLPTEELQREVAEKATAQGLSVRQVEQMVHNMTKAREVKKADTPEPVDPNVKAAIGELEAALGTRVRIVEKAPGKGKIEIDYYSQDDLDRIYAVITGESFE
ncbi:MAG: ParB/RepB/Spo0J family partition protein [Acidobacteriota bacterium]|jgi:ParB family chromosome partitioning protein|nr:ParB/RepB/Spo0J family partition protein [Bryobacteraceae bacterium CoA2 C42]